MLNYDPKKDKINPKCCQICVQRLEEKKCDVIFPNQSFAHLQQLQSLMGLVLVSSQPSWFCLTCLSRNLGLSGLAKMSWPFLMRFTKVHVPLGVELLQGLLLPLDQLVHVLDAGRSDVSGGGEHDPVQELDVRLQLVPVGVASPVEVDHDLGLGHGRDELLVLLDKVVQQVVHLVLGPLSHQDLQNLPQPFLHLDTLQVFTQGLKIITILISNTFFCSQTDLVLF